DASGTIGWQLVGEAPVRKKGHGALPQSGANLGAGWRPEPVPFEQMPHCESPECGWLATANNNPQPEGGPFLSLDFLEGYRFQGVGQGLQARDDWDIASTMQLQMDERALAWLELREHVLGVEVQGPALEGQKLLREWDGVVSEGSPAASVYE